MIKQRYDFDEVRKIYQENQKQLDNLVQNIVQLSCENGQTIATAESCTGGLLSQKITAVPGASQMFALGICTYTNEMKTAILHVPESTLHTYTAVSPQTAIAMAKRRCSTIPCRFRLICNRICWAGRRNVRTSCGDSFFGCCVSWHCICPCICRLTGWAFLLEKVSGKERQSVHLALQGKF